MKKTLALTLALLLLTAAFTACGGGSKATEKPETIALDFKIAEAGAEPTGFLCVVDRGDEYHWKDGATSFEELYEEFDLYLDQTTYINVYVPDGQEGTTRDCYVVKETMFAWFSDEFQDGATDAYNEWLNQSK